MAEPPTDLPGHNFLDTITVCVGGGEGEEQQEFIIHKTFATKSSKVLRAALRGDWKEACEKRIPLPESKAADFQIYAEWLCTGHFGSLVKELSSALSATLVRLYVLGDYIDDATFCNEVMDILMGRKALAEPGQSIEVPDEVTAWALDRTAAGSPLRAFLFTSVALQIGSEKGMIASLRSRFSSDTLLDLVSHVVGDEHLGKTINGALTEKARLLLERCAFHRHVDGDATCSGS